MRKYLSLLAMLVALEIIPSCGLCKKDCRCGDPCPPDECVMETAYVDDLYDYEDTYMAENDVDEPGNVVVPQKI